MWDLGKKTGRGAKEGKMKLGEFQGETLMVSNSSSMLDFSSRMDIVDFL